MAFKFSIPFFAFRLHLHPGTSFLAPLSDNTVLRTGQPLELAARQYKEALQRKVLNQGNFEELLNEYQEGDFYRGEIDVSFEASRDGISHPEFSLEFPYFFNYQDKGTWAAIPTLGIEAFAEEEAQLPARLREAIRLEFTKSRRLQAVQEVVAAIWFESVELKQKEVQMEAPLPRELDKMQGGQQERLLPQAASLLNTNQRVVYGREKEIGQLARILKGKFTRNVLLIGPSGCGKTALVWELARQQKKRRIKARIWETTASTLIKELMRDTGWQENLSVLCRELSASGDILFVRNLMELFEVGKYEGNDVSMADYLRPFISRGEITLISECTEEELAKIELSSAHYLAFFQRVYLKEPEEKAMEQIILKKVQDIARVKQAAITEEAIREVIRLSRRFTPYAGMPGRPIRFLESLLLSKKTGADPSGELPEAGRSEVIRQFCEETGMPQFMIDPDIPMEPGAVRASFNTQLFGQEAAVDSLVGLLSAVKTSLTRTGKPIASLLFVGPTGVGKTELAKILAGFMFGSRERLTRFDMSEFSSPFSVMRLAGTHYFSEGLLTSAIRREPFTVLLFDEIEKAHPTFFDLLLQILSEGRLTDAQGKLVNFCSTIIIMTSNIGSQNLNANPIGWKQSMEKEQVQQHFLSEVERYFRPELFNRIDQVIPFAPLDVLTVRFVVEREIELIKKREGIRFRRMSLDIDEEVLDYLAMKGYNSKYGARQLQRIIREELLIPLSKALNTQDIHEHLKVKAGMQGKRITIDAAVDDALGLELVLEEYTKISYADHASGLRRQLEQLKEGHYYVRLQSELDILEQKKKKAGQQFWENAQLAKKYTYYLEARQHVEELGQSLEALEMKLSLSCLDAGPYEPAWIDQLQAWEEDFFRLKMEMYQRLHSQADTVFLGIYGSSPERLAAFYEALLKAKEYAFESQGVWFRESYYNEEVVVPADEGTNKKRRQAYIKKPYRPESGGQPEPPQEGDVFWGIEYTIHGPCAFLFLNEEGGIQRWHENKDSPAYYLAVASNEPLPTPKKIHRKDFYTKQPPRRVVGPQTVKDAVYKLNREYNKTGLLGLIMEKIEERFHSKLDAEIL